jgi:hypothetical protein
VLNCHRLLIGRGMGGEQGPGGRYPSAADEPGLLIEPPFVWMTVGCRLAGGRPRHDRQRQFGLVFPASVWFVGSHGYSMARGCITGS